MTFVIKNPNQPSDRPVEASLELDNNGWLTLNLNGQPVVSINPTTGRLLLMECLKPSEVPGIALDTRGAIQLCCDDADFYKRS